MKKILLLVFLTLIVALCAFNVAATQVELKVYDSVGEMLTSLNKQKTTTAQTNVQTNVQVTTQPIIQVFPQPIFIYKNNKDNNDDKSSFYKKSNYKKYPSYSDKYDGFSGQYNDYLKDQKKEKEFYEYIYYKKYMKQYKPGTKIKYPYDPYFNTGTYDGSFYQPPIKAYTKGPKIDYKYYRDTYIKPTYFEEDFHHLTPQEYAYHYDQEYRNNIIHQEYHGEDIPHGHDYWFDSN